MAEIQPFKGLRYNTNIIKLEEVITEPYDRITPTMQDDYYKRNPYSVVRIILGKENDPDYPEKGFREFHIIPEKGEAKFWVAKRDVKNLEKGQIIRLMELFNFQIDKIEKGTPEGIFHSEGHEEAKKLKS